MVAHAKSVPDTWSEHEKIGDTAQGWAMHAMVLDIDVGPMLQTHKLLTSVLFARAKGYTRPLTAAELEMMNLTGDGTGLDMVTMPQAMREQVPTSNFFQRGGYERNPVAIRHNTVAKLLAVTDRGWTPTATMPARGSWRRRFSTASCLFTSPAMRGDRSTRGWRSTATRSRHSAIAGSRRASRARPRGARQRSWRRARLTDPTRT